MIGRDKLNCRRIPLVQEGDVNAKNGEYFYPEKKSQTDCYD